MLKFGLVGKRLDYSFSKTFFTALFEERGIEAVYENIEIEAIDKLKTHLETGNFSGLNVTIPYKTDVISLLDELSDEARAVGAVNTIQFLNDKLIGHNTDVFGFRQSIKPFLNNKHERVAILGTGGAAKAVAYVFRSIGLDVVFVSRNPLGENEFAYSDINANFLNSFKVLVNCTPLGTFPDIDEMPPVPTQYFTPEHFVIDLIYNPEQTRLLREAALLGAITLNGYSMLKEQALKSWDIWNNLP